MSDHDVRHDRPSGRAGDWERPGRLTCRAEACGGDTLLRQPWMGGAHWDGAVRAFMAAHPTELVRPADRGRPTLRWDGHGFTREDRPPAQDGQRAPERAAAAPDR